MLISAAEASAKSGSGDRDQAEVERNLQSLRALMPVLLGETGEVSRYATPTPAPLPPLSTPRKSDSFTLLFAFSLPRPHTTHPPPTTTTPLQVTGVKGRVKDIVKGAAQAELPEYQEKYRYYLAAQTSQSRPFEGVAIGGKSTLDAAR